jgi:hypothetical protein
MTRKDPNIGRRRAASPQRRYSIVVILRRIKYSTAKISIPIMQTRRSVLKISAVIGTPFWNKGSVPL